jgi:hypothetical protein
MNKKYLYIYIYLILQNTEHIESLDAQVVKQAVVEAIKNWSESSEQ